jgi:bifunctional non-homologous end joining protein LigD
MRALPLSMRKTNLARPLRGRPDGIRLNKVRSAPPYSGRPASSGLRDWCQSIGSAPTGRANWVKVKNPKRPAIMRVNESLRNRS